MAIRPHGRKRHLTEGVLAGLASPRASGASIPGARQPRGDGEWWREAVIYQVYVRSFADANGDGIGDLAGVRSKLPYLRDLGVDATWFTPWYASPMEDGGYDVADYRAIDPAFGTLREAENLIGEALELGIRTIIDIVPNHVSDQHPWFQAALAAGPGSPERARFWFHPGRGHNGDEMPTTWPSNFSGTSWTRTTNSDGTPGEWYLHLFSAHQPDLNWNHPAPRGRFKPTAGRPTGRQQPCRSTALPRRNGPGRRAFVAGRADSAPLGICASLAQIWVLSSRDESAGNGRRRFDGGKQGGSGRGPWLLLRRDRPNPLRRARLAGSPVVQGL